MRFLVWSLAFLTLVVELRRRRQRSTPRLTSRALAREEALRTRDAW